MTRVQSLESRQRTHFEGSDFKPARLEELVGMPTVREELARLIRLLRNYKRYRSSLPAGVLFFGEPGMGKTLASRILATETGAKFVDATNFPLQQGSWSPTDLNSLFSLAKKHHSRTGKLVLLHFEELSPLCETKDDRQRAATQAALLSNLEGVSGRLQGVFVVACTNNLRSIPEALIRPGRLRVVEFSIDREGKKEVLRYYLSKEGLKEERLVRSLPPSLTPAAIEQMVKDAVARAGQEGRRPTLADFVQSLYRLVLGPPDESWETEEERWITCIHEAGHVSVSRALGAEVKLVAVPKRGYRKGITLVDWGAKRFRVETQEKAICNLLAGKQAEEMFGFRSWDEPEDIGLATSLSLERFSEHEPHTNYMYDKLLLEMDDFNPGFAPLRVPEAERGLIYERARELRERCLERARKILKGAGKDCIERLAKMIHEREFLLAEEIEEFFKKQAHRSG
jgi:cell division protease FtsH